VRASDRLALDMLHTTRGLRGMVVSPHHLASQAGLEVLKDGGSAVEAAVATAATLCVVYPHMNGLGGDGFWLIANPGSDPVGVEACGRAAAAADIDFYRARGLKSIPWRGPAAANTVAGMVSGWRLALEVDGSRMPLSRLMAPAIAHARDGFPAADGLAATLAGKQAELECVPGFSEVFLEGGRAPLAGQRVRLPKVAATLDRLVDSGLDDFYRGDLARSLARDLQNAGAPLTLADMEAHRASTVQPLRLATRGDSLFNMPPPTQGVASLLILALFDRLGVVEQESFAHIHGLVEATKRAFLVRDRCVGDPIFAPFDAQAFLDDGAELDRLAAEIDRTRALPWPQPPSAGDTVWFGAMDAKGGAASVIQSTYFEFGSGLVLPETGVLWQNRGASFRLAEAGWNALRPGRKPFHTLNPAMAALADGRFMAYGTMGGEGQPQTQAAVFSRFARFGQGLQAAVTAPRWLLGRTWGDHSTSLKLEDGFDPTTVAALQAAGHLVEGQPRFTSLMGHAGALVRGPDGSLEGAFDPRSDGAVAAW
jgi:gamma-glutamyltranspeptidase